MKMNSDLFLITSVINTGIKPWTYTLTRSIYTPEQRLDQTINETVSSIRSYHPTAKILLVECSGLPDEYETKLKICTDYYINMYKDEEVRKACLESNKKGYGEVLLTIRALDYIKNNNILFRRMFKISGRYYLTKDFNESNFSDKLYTFNNKNSTVLYSVPYCLSEDFYTQMSSIKTEYEKSSSLGLENILPKIEPKKTIDLLGVAGLVAIDHSFYIA